MKERFHFDDTTPVERPIVYGIVGTQNAVTGTATAGEPVLVKTTSELFGLAVEPVPN